MEHQPPEPSDPRYETVDEILAGESPRVLGLVDIIRRSGAYSMQIRFVDDPEPVIWCCVTTHYLDEAGMPTNDTNNRLVVEAAAGWTVGIALKRLAETLIDGGQCRHCGRRSALVNDVDDVPTFMQQVACLVHWSEREQRYALTCQEAT